LRLNFIEISKTEMILRTGISLYTTH